MATIPKLGSIALLSGSGGGNVAAERQSGQVRRDRERRTYRLVFPSEVKPDQVCSYFSELSGILRPKTSLVASALNLRDVEQLFRATPSITLDMHGTDAGYNWYISVPYGYEPPARMRLESLVPGIQITHVPTLDT